MSEIVDPADVLASAVTERTNELHMLVAGLETSMQVVCDVDSVNAAIIDSPRPELVITEPVVDMFRIASPYETGRLNNFNANIAGFGIPLFRDELSPITNRVQPKMIGRRSLTAEERELYFFMGARGNYDEHFAFAMDNGVDEATAKDMRMETCLSRESFMRMWIALPEFTVFLMDACLYKNFDPDSRVASKDNRYERFAAYSVMSRLVDRMDRGIVKPDNTIDDWQLCR
jgi:hypothetical protein